MSPLIWLACAGLTIRQRLASQRDTPRQVLGALALWPLAYFLLVALRYGWLYPGSPTMRLLPGQPGDQQWLAALVNAAGALLLWTAISRLAFHGMTRQSRRWLLFPAILFFVLVAFVRVGAGPAALLAAPLVGMCRWRSEVRPRVRFIAWLIAVVALLAAIFKPTIAGITPPTTGFPAAAAHFADQVTGVAGMQALLLSWQLLSGGMVTIRRIDRRLALSHLLIGAVPLFLALIFWGFGSYVSVGTERAQSATRLLEAEAARLEGALVAAARLEPAAPPERLAALLGVRYPGARVLVEADSLRLEGAARPNWPDSLPSHGMVIVRGEGFLGAIDRSTAPRRLVLQPVGDFVSAGLGPPLGAELRLLVETHVTTSRRNLVISDASSDTLDGTAVARPETDDGPQRVSGAALVPVLRAGRTSWSRDQVLLTAHVPWRRAAVGLFTGLKENPFSLVPIIILGLVALLLAIVWNITVRMVVRMSRSVTAAVGALKSGTQALREGRLDYRIPIRPEDRDELWDVAESFNTMAQGLEEARENERERERLEKELQLARQIQARLLPDGAPRVSGVELAGLSFSAQEVGGDYYDFIPLADGRVGLVIADVSGKGVPAALLMSAFRASLLSQALGGEDPGLLLARINGFLHRSVEPGRFVTAFLALLDPATGRLQYANAGHNPPVVLTAGAGAPRELSIGGTMLGAFADGAWSSETVELGPGDLLVLYTDGVTEAQDPTGEFWGEERLNAFLASHHGMEVTELARAIIERVRQFEGSTGPSDDITLLLARRQKR